MCRDGYAPRSLMHAEQMPLEGAEHELEDNGQARKWPRGFQPTLEFIRFVFDTYFRFYGRPNPINCGGDGWRSFRQAYEVRNRVTHPNRLEDLEIGDEELTSLGVASSWFLEGVFKKF